MKISATIRTYVSAAGLAGILTGLFCAAFHPLEPRFQGKRLSQWADILALPWDAYPNEQMAKEAESLRGKAENAIRHIGARALPYAIKWCQAIQPTQRQEALEGLSEKELFGVKLKELFVIPHGHYLSADDLHRRSEEIFRILGPDAEPAIPVLLRLWENKDFSVVGAATGNLQDIGPGAIAPAVAALTNSNVQIRRTAALFFANPGLTNTSACSALVLSLRDQDSEVREFAASSLGLIALNGSNVPAMVAPALTAALKKERDPMGMLRFIGALARFGTNAQIAVPVLKNIIESQPTTPFNLRWVAMCALKRIDPETSRPLKNGKPA